MLRTADLDRCACHRTAVGPQDRRRDEDSDESVEVTVLRSGDKGVDNASLNLHVGVRSGVALRLSSRRERLRRGRGFAGDRIAVYQQLANVRAALRVEGHDRVRGAAERLERQCVRAPQSEHGEHREVSAATE